MVEVKAETWVQLYPDKHEQTQLRRRLPSGREVTGPMLWSFATRITYQERDNGLILVQPWRKLR